MTVEPPPKHPAAVTPAGAQIRRRPGQQQIQPDLRQIGVAIRMGVVRYLHHPDHRNHHPHIPQPADNQAGMRPAKCPRRSGDGQQQPTARPPARAAGSLRDRINTRHPEG